MLKRISDYFLLEECKKLIKKGWILLQTPDEILQEVETKIVIYRCNNVVNGLTENPPLNEELTAFENTTYYSRGLKYETLEFRFRDKETAYEAALKLIENETWVVFFPNYIDYRYKNWRCPSRG